MKKCDECNHYKVLNPHQIEYGVPVLACDLGEHPEYCKEIKEKIRYG